MSTNTNDAVELIVHGTGTGMCPLEDKESEGITVTFRDGSFRECFLSFKGFHKILKMKLAQAKKAAPPRQAPQEVRAEARPAVPTAAAPVNGPK